MPSNRKGTNHMTTLKSAAVALALLTFSSLGCDGAKTETRSMEQIYADEGVPVRFETLMPQQFVREAEFTAVLTGIEESSAYAAVADRIDRINAEVGDYVSKDSVILTFPTDNPSANYYQAKVQYENARANFNRMKEYFETGGLSRQDFDNAEASFRVAEANWDAVRQSVLVRAPISGVLTRLNVRESDNVEKEEELFAVSRTDKLKATVWVPDYQVQSIASGMPASATWQGETLSGTVVQVDRSVNRQRQAFGVTVEFDNSRGDMQSGITAVISIATYVKDSALVTKRKNVLSDNEGSYVFLDDNNNAVKRYVTLGESYALDIEIADGVSAGDRLVTEGQLHLENGTRLKVIDDVTVEGSVAAHEQ